MKRTVRISALLVAVLMLLSLCGCGSSNHSSQSYTAAREDGAYAADYDFEGYAAAEMAADEAYGFAPVPAPNASASASASGSGIKEGDVPAEDPEKIIYAADVTVETTTLMRRWQV